LQNFPMARQRSDPSLEGYLGDYLRWALVLLAVLCGIAGLAFVCAKPAVRESEAWQPPGETTPDADAIPTRAAGH